LCGEGLGEVYAEGELWNNVDGLSELADFLAEPVPQPLRV